MWFVCLESFIRSALSRLSHVFYTDEKLRSAALRAGARLVQVASPSKKGTERITERHDGVLMFTPWGSKDWTEATYYPDLSKFTDGLDLIGKPRQTSSMQMSLSSVMSNDSLDFWSPRMMPEVFVHPRQGSRNPGYSAEGKTWDITAIPEVITYSGASMSYSYFDHRIDSNDAYPFERFYFRPPVGIGLIASGPVAFVCTGQWIGVLVFRPSGKPFFLGSDDHKTEMTAAVESVKAANVKDGEWVDITASDFILTCSDTGFENNIIWNAKPLDNKFYKIIHSAVPWGKDKPINFLRIHEVYSVLSSNSGSKVVDKCTGLVQSRLLYGEFKVAVEMEWILLGPKLSLSNIKKMKSSAN